MFAVFGKRVFRAVINHFEMKRSPHIIWWNLNASTSILIRDGNSNTKEKDAKTAERCGHHSAASRNQKRGIL